MTPLLKRILSDSTFQDMPGAIRRISDIPPTGEAIVILSSIESVDDCVYRITAKDIAMAAHNQYLSVDALVYTPSRAAHVTGLKAPIIFSYQTLGVMPTAFTARNPIYTLLHLETYQKLCKQGVYEPKGQSGKDALRL